MSLLKAFVGVLLALPHVLSQQPSGLGVYECRPDSGLYDLTACDYVNSTYYACGNTPMNDTFFNCICTQDFLSGLFK